MTNEAPKLLNDVNIDAVFGLAGKIQEAPDVAATKWNVEVDWKGGFRSEATIREFAPIVSDEPGLRVFGLHSAFIEEIEQSDREAR